MYDFTDPTAPPAIQRRDFVRSLSAAATAALMADAPRNVLGGDVIVHPKASADACILLWMGGGMAAPDTFDPKRYEPYREGLEVARMLSTFPAINTSVDGLQIC